jgi:hypothetical protein
MMRLKGIRFVRHVGRIGEKRNAYRLLVGKPEGRRPRRRPRHRLDNIRLDLVEIVWGDVDLNGLTQDKDKWRSVVMAVMNLLVL